LFRIALRKLFGSKNERELKRIWPLVTQINALEPKFEKLGDEELRHQTVLFKERLAAGESLDQLLPEAFAVTREAAKRILGMRHFDVQLVGGIVLHEGRIAEMKTGEGKTLCATLPVYLNALTGKGVHVVTVNDYLARRDAESMGRLYAALGLTTGVILSGIDPDERRHSYACDITYGQNNEFGFDYLRDNMKLELEEMAQRGHQFAIVDEVDSILVDEARTPLIISGPSDEATDKYRLADDIVRKLKAETDYTVELKTKQVMLTEEGVTHVEKILQVENLYDPRNIQIVHHINQSLKGHVTMRRDVDYVVRNNQVIIVDEFTGRLMSGRRWSDGLHQAVEAKEHVPIARENQTLATVTFQNYFRMYKKLAGMTGTADTEAVEFKKIYNLDVIVIPTNRSMIRVDNPDVVFLSEKAKFKAVCDEIEELNKKGQPILVGTASIEKSEVLSELLKKRGVPHHVLNAKQHEREAEIVAQAGRYGAVTISTNMAGRGTDILLGGNPEFLAASAADTKDPEDENFQTQLRHFKELCLAEREKVIAAGGLHILGTERHESRRIDNQLRGRGGRQGDPGSSRFYISLEDDLMKRFGGESIKTIMSRFGMKEEDAIEGPVIAKQIMRAQSRVEGYHFDIRKHLLEYDNVMNKQREVIYSLRDRILRHENSTSDEIETEILQMVEDVVEDIIIVRANEKESTTKWDIGGIINEFNRIFGFQFGVDSYIERAEKAIGKEFAQVLYDELTEQAKQRYFSRKEHFGAERMLKLERIVYLQAIDFFWKEHLSNIDHVKEGIGLRGYGQKNPLFEYQNEAYELFSAMMLTTKASVLQNVFIPELPSDEELRKIEEQEREAQKRREAAAKTIHEAVSDRSIGDDGMSEDRAEVANEGDVSDLPSRELRREAAKKKTKEVNKVTKKR
jgi:preprotein translocase subunit SecA